MKKFSTIIIVLTMIVLASLVSCEDYLEANPEMGIDDQAVYSEYYNYKALVDRGNWLVMNQVATKTDWGSFVGSLSDEQQAVNPSKPPYNSVNQGLFLDYNWRDFGLTSASKENSSSDADYLKAPAGKSLKAIRAMGLAIENIDQLVDFPAELGYSSEELRNQLLGQAYALRGWHQFEVIRRYGPILLVDTVGGGRKTFSSEYIFDIERPTFQRCADLIAADCDEAVKYLPSKWDSPTDVGRLTKTSARAIKAMVYLYAASPLMNTGDGTFPDGVAFPFGQDSYNIDYAKKGIKAFVDALNEMNNGTRYKLYDKEHYLENWMRQGAALSDEALFEAVPTNFQNWSLPMNATNQGTGWFQPQHDGGWALFNVPTQNAVDKFETLNGYEVNNFQSSDPEFDPAHPYENRDPRLKWNIFCPGDTMYLTDPDPNRKKAAYTNEAWSNPGDEGWHYAFYSGKKLVYTGYFAAGKWRKLGYNKWDKNYNQQYYRSFPHIRVADLYLGLAELANEVYGPTAAIPEASGIDVTTAQEALNKIRNRVGMPDVTTSDVTEFRESVRNEWAVEFYGEFRRWRDMRRWKIAKEEFAKGIFAVDVTKNPDGTFEYVNKKLDVPRVYEDKHDWYAIDTKYIDMFERFKQNPGW